MNELITAINNFVNWLQMPAWGFLAVTLVIGGTIFTQELKVFRRVKNGLWLGL